MARTETVRPGRLETIATLLRLPLLVRLDWRLMRDRRVPVWPKAMLVGALLYVIMPFDLIPDTIPFVGEVDDVVVVVVTARWFLHWCPRDVVREHARVVGVDVA